jgi:hypothetical protein
MLVPMAQASAAAAPTYKLLEYKYVPDILEKRGPYRADHLAGAQKKVGPSKAHVLAHSALQAAAPPADTYRFKRTVLPDLL